MIAIVDYKMGNLASVKNAFAKLGKDTVVESEPQKFQEYDKLILPGVGAFGDCAQGLQAVEGMNEALEEAVIKQGKPFLGICVGMQLLAQTGLEHGRHEGLGWIQGTVKAIEPNDPALKIPHMGWNTLNICSDEVHPLLHNIKTGSEGEHAYFVHSYHFKTKNPADDLAETQYGGRVTAMVGRDNIVGVQFHPEKSQKMGLKLIENFLNWKP